MSRKLHMQTGGGKEREAFKVHVLARNPEADLEKTASGKKRAHREKYNAMVKPSCIKLIFAKRGVNH
jgi:hypothetical protein